MKSYFQLFLVCLTALVCFSSCNKDEDSVSNDCFLIGTWSECDREGFPLRYEQHIWTFNSDGTGYFRVEKTEDEIRPGYIKFKFNGTDSKGYVTIEEDDGEKLDAIVSYDGFIMTWAWSDEPNWPMYFRKE